MAASADEDAASGAEEATFSDTERTALSFIWENFEALPWPQPDMYAATNAAIKNLADALLKEGVKSRTEKVQRQTFAQQFLEENQEWIPEDQQLWAQRCVVRLISTTKRQMMRTARNAKAQSSSSKSKNKQPSPVKKKAAVKESSPDADKTAGTSSFDGEEMSTSVQSSIPAVNNHGLQGHAAQLSQIDIKPFASAASLTPQPLDRQPTMTSPVSTSVASSPLEQYYLCIERLANGERQIIKRLALFLLTERPGGAICLPFNHVSSLSFSKLSKYAVISESETFAYAHPGTPNGYHCVTDDADFITAAQYLISQAASPADDLVMYVFERNIAPQFPTIQGGAAEALAPLLLDPRVVSTLNALVNEGKRKYNEAFPCDEGKGPSWKQTKIDDYYEPDALDTVTPSLEIPMEPPLQSHTGPDTNGPLLDTQLQTPPSLPDIEVGRSSAIPSENHQPATTEDSDGDKDDNVDDDDDDVQILSIVPKRPKGATPPKPLQDQDFAYEDQSLEDMPPQEEMQDNYERTADELTAEFQSNPDFATGFLNQLACTQFTKENIEDYHTFFGHSIAVRVAWKPGNEMKNVPGLLTAIKNGNQCNIRGYQHFAAWWILTHEYNYDHGGLLGDEPGYGKTLIIIYTTVLYYLIIENQRDVELSREGGKSRHKHLAEDEEGICAGSRHYGFACSCQKDSPTERELPNAGATVVIALKSVLSAWTAEFDAWLDTKIAPLRVVALHADFTKGPHAWKPADVTKYAAKMPVYPKVGPVRMDLPYWHPENWDAIQNDPDRPYAEQTNQHALVLISTWNSAKTRIFKNLQYTIRNRHFPQFTYRCKDKEICPKAVYGACNKKAETHQISCPEDETVPTLEFARFWIDESHLIKGEKHSFMGELYQARALQEQWYNTSFCLWPVSGTPYPGGPVDLQIWLAFHNPELCATYTKLVNRFLALNAQQRDGQELSERDKERLQRAYKFITETMMAYVIRRDDDTKDADGGRLVKLPPLKIIEVAVDMQKHSLLDKWWATESLNYTQQEARELDDPNKHVSQKISKTVRLSRMFTSFPYLSSIGRPTYEMHTSNWIKKNRCYSDEDEYYGSHLLQLCKSSPKFKVLTDIVNELPQVPSFIDGKIHETKTSRAKLILCSACPATCLVLYKLFKTGDYGYSPDEVEAFHSGLSTKERTAIIERFQQSALTEGGLKEAYGKDIGLLVLNSRVGGVGITLTKAKRLLMFEPFSDVAMEQQTRRRFYRVGQTEECTLFRLCSDWHNLETEVHKKSDDRMLLAHMFTGFKPDDKVIEVGG
ncbi:hypothetical protein KCU78_g3914, partial [Aureobasidium melanogenum]